MKTAKRIREAMEKNGWKQVDVITIARAILEEDAL